MYNIIYKYKNYMKQIIRIANNYNPLPVNIVRGKDVFLWDACGKIC